MYTSAGVSGATGVTVLGAVVSGSGNGPAALAVTGLSSTLLSLIAIALILVGVMLAGVATKRRAGNH